MGGAPSSAGDQVDWAKFNPMHYIRPIQVIANLALWVLYLVGACVVSLLRSSLYAPVLFDLAVFEH
jgi:hypothetical protein